MAHGQDRGLALLGGPQGEPQGEHSPTGHPDSPQSHLGLERGQQGSSQVRKEPGAPGKLGRVGLEPQSPSKERTHPGPPDTGPPMPLEGGGYPAPSPSVCSEALGPTWNPKLPAKSPKPDISPPPPGSSPLAKWVPQAPSENLSNFPWDPEASDPLPSRAHPPQVPVRDGA